MASLFKPSPWLLGLGVAAALAAGYVLNPNSQPKLSSAEIETLSQTLLETDQVDPAYKGDLVCERYATEIAYLSECERMFSGGSTGPCPARAAPQNIAIPTSIDGLAVRILDLERLVDENCNAPLTDLMLRISKDPVR